MSRNRPPTLIKTGIVDVKALNTSLSDLALLMSLKSRRIKNDLITVTATPKTCTDENEDTMMLKRAVESIKNPNEFHPSLKKAHLKAMIFEAFSTMKIRVKK